MTLCAGLVCGADIAECSVALVAGRFAEVRKDQKWMGSAFCILTCSAVESCLPLRRYNIFVPAASPQHRPDAPRPHIYTLEAAGLLIIAALIMIITLARYWHHIPWSAR